MTTDSYKALLAQAVKVEAQIREHHIIMVRRAMASLSTNDDRRLRCLQQVQSLDTELSKIIRDYDKIDNIIDFLMYKMGVED